MIKSIGIVVAAVAFMTSSGQVVASDSTQDALTKIRAERAVRELLRDGRTAEFRNVDVKRTENDVRYTCGEVNAKNAFGGYGGYQRFISLGQATFLQEQVDDFEPVWRQFCS